MSFEVRVTAPMRNEIFVSERRNSTSSCVSSASFTSSLTVLRGMITPGIPAEPVGASSSTRARRWPSVAAARSTWRPSLSTTWK